MAEQDHELIALGRAVRQLREQQNMTEGELAAAAGLKLRRLDAIETGRSDPHYDGLLALARGLNIKPGELMRRADAEAKNGDA